MIVGPEHVRLHHSPLLVDLELDTFGETRTEYVTSSTTRDHIPSEHETQPLIYPDSGPSFNNHIAGRGTPGRQSKTSIARRSQRYQDWGYIAAVMEKLENSRLAHFANKLAVSSEPGLTNAQLMLHNFDLKPGK